MIKKNNPFELLPINNTVQVWYGPPNEPESEFILHVSIDWLPQLIETLQELQGKQP
jgi:hypothetical protein